MFSVSDIKAVVLGIMIVLVMVVSKLETEQKGGRAISMEHAQMQHRMG